MKNKKMTEEDIRSILKEDGLEKPTDLFSDRLIYSIVQQHRKKEAVAFKAAKWVGKFILGILVSLNLLFLYYLNPFPKQSVLFISVAAFILGIWGIIAVTKKFQLSKFNALRPGSSD